MDRGVFFVNRHNMAVYFLKSAVLYEPAVALLLLWLGLPEGMWGYSGGGEGRHRKYGDIVTAGI